MQRLSSGVSSLVQYDDHRSGNKPNHGSDVIIPSAQTSFPHASNGEKIEETINISSFATSSVPDEASNRTSDLN